MAVEREKVATKHINDVIPHTKHKRKIFAVFLLIHSTIPFIIKDVLHA